MGKFCAEGEVEVGFAEDAEGAVVVMFPEVFAVVGGAGTAMHADGGDGNEVSEAFEVGYKVKVGGLDVTVAGGEAFVMVADFVA